MRWAILAVFVAGCGQAAATAPVAATTASAAASHVEIPTSNFGVASPPIDQLPPGVSPRGWQVTFTSGRLSGQTQAIPRYILNANNSPISDPSLITTMTGYGCEFGGRWPVVVDITPARSLLTLTFSGNGMNEYGEIVVPNGGLSFSGSGTYRHADGSTSSFSADVVAIP